jgi:tRNA G46 methylase TrmB
VYHIADPSFPAVVALGGQFICRSNWRTYCEELNFTLETIMRYMNISFEIPKTQEYITREPITHFEAKFMKANVPIYQTSSMLGCRDYQDRLDIVSNVKKKRG